MKTRQGKEPELSKFDANELFAANFTSAVRALKLKPGLYTNRRLLESLMKQLVKPSGCRLQGGISSYAASRVSTGRSGFIDRDETYKCFAMRWLAGGHDLTYEVRVAENGQVELLRHAYSGLSANRLSRELMYPETAELNHKLESLGVRLEEAMINAALGV